MKKTILAISVIAFSINNGLAQSVTFGAKAGIVASNQTRPNTIGGPEITETSSTIIGFYVGGLAEVKITQDFAIQPELGFSTMGGIYNKGDQRTDVINDWKLKYGFINLPILLKYEVNKFSAFLGPQFGFVVSAKEKFNGRADDWMDNTAATEFSAILGIGYTLISNIGFDVRYQLGLSSISGQNYKSKNKAFTVGVHYYFIE